MGDDLMAAVRCEEEAFADDRYDDLAVRAGLADADHARGKMLRIWRQCTIENSYFASPDFLRRILGPNGPEALVGARLGELVEDGFVRVRGAQGRVEWLESLRKNGKKGGRPKKLGPKPSGYGVGSVLETMQRARAGAIDRTECVSVSGQESGSSQLPDPDIGGPRDLVQDRGSARDAGFRVPQPNDAHVATSAPVGAPAISSVEPLTQARGALVRELGRIHREAYERARSDLGLGGKVPGMAAVGDSAERALQDLIREQISLDGFAERARHVIAVRDHEARRLNTLKFFGASMWSAKNFGIAVSMQVGEDRRGPDKRSAFEVADEVFDKLEAREREGKA